MSIFLKNKLLVKKIDERFFISTLFPFFIFLIDIFAKTRIEWFQRIHDREPFFIVNQLT